jgi:hypothetical protein
MMCGVHGVDAYAKIDYVKIDACGPPCHPIQNTSWIRFRKALDACEAETNRSMLM